MGFVVMKMGGEPDDVAINANLVTHIRSASGPYTDIYFKEHCVAVELPFQEVLMRLASQDQRSPDGKPERHWLTP